MTLHNVEHDLSLTTLVLGTSKISLTSLRTSDINSFRDAFNDEIIFIVSFIPTCFSSTIFFKDFIWISNLNLSRSLLKSEDIAKVHDQNLPHPKLLKAVFPLSEEFQCNISAEVKILVVVLFNCTNCRYKFYRSLSFLRMTQNFSFLGGFGSSISSFRFDALNFSKNIRKLASSLMPCNDEKHIFAIYWAL